MNFSGKLFAGAVLVLFVSIAATAGDKGHEQLKVERAATYPYKLTSEGVTIAADVYETGDKIKAAFGKHNPYDHGVLPILVIIDNHSSKPIRVDRLTVQYEAGGRTRVDATPPGELKYLSGSRRPEANPAPLPIPGLPGVNRNKKNPLSDWEIEGRAFAAQVIPPEESASGFFYFQTGHRSNSTLYVSGISEVGTGRQLVFFEIPLAPVQ